MNIGNECFKFKQFEYCKLLKCKNFLIFHLINFFFIINHDKNFTIKLRTNIINITSLIKTVYFKFRLSHFIILMILYNYLYITEWYLIYLCRKYIILFKLSIYICYKNFLNTKSYWLFPFYYLVNKISFFFKRKTGIKKSYKFLYMLFYKYNVYMTLTVIVDIQNIFLNEIVINKTFSINKNKNFFKHQLNNIKKKKFCEAVQCPVFKYDLMAQERVYYKRAILLLKKSWDHSYNTLSITKIGIRMKNANIFFNILKFFSKNFLKISSLKNLKNTYIFILYNYKMIRKYKKTFIFINLINGRVGLLLKNHYFYIRIVIFKKWHVVKKITFKPMLVVRKHVIFIKALLEDVLSSICKLKCKYVYFLHSNAISVMYLNLYYTHLLILKNKSKILISDKNTVMLIQDYKIKKVSKSFKNIKYIYI
uniref:Uncharacterized protein n=1 Tax=Lotharella vacuolata TaxID=74820 RepID=A0A0H5BHF0_9EUKA|nr:hypothetical protein [Lotharella vacuolata]